MKKQYTIFWATTVIIASAWPLAAAPMTNIWFFKSSSQYVVSDTPLIEVKDGVARIIPQPNPWITPAPTYGCPFLGNVIGFTHRLATNNADTDVRYQISGNNGSNWYVWMDGRWSDVTACTNSLNNRLFANEIPDIQAHIGSFYEQIYAKTGGVFKFRAFLKYNAATQVALEDVSVLYSPGRIVVTVPNGLEVGQQGWLIGVPYTVQWTSAGIVGSKVKLEYSLDSGTTWGLITNNVANVAGTNNYAHWRTPTSVSNKVRIRVTAMDDATINDVSDCDFSICERLQLSGPNGGEKWYTGETNAIRWESPF